jgi:NAD(P)H-hydrate repair Nnr-like enzyme with NAD(P)H-hydrate dehydratase domain
VSEICSWVIEFEIRVEADYVCTRAGQLGRVGVIGGSEDYTGAPYFSAMASARLGCDMVGFTSFVSFVIR